MEERKKRFAVPHVYVILLGLVLISSLLSYVIPAGQFDMVTIDGREVVDASTFREVDPTPVTLMQLLSAVPRGMEESAQIIFFIFFVGGSFAILNKTGAIEAGIGSVYRLLKGKTLLLLPGILLLFSLGGAVFGMSEETLPFIPIFVSLCIAMGYDSLTGLALILCGEVVGYGGAFINPFTVQVAQGIAGLPILSGMDYRIIIYVVYLIMASTFIMIYASRIKRNPEKSSMYAEDRCRKDVIDINHIVPFTGKRKIILAIFTASVLMLVYCIINWGWYMTEIAALFFGMSIVIAIVAGMKPNDFAATFSQGMTDIATGALVVGFARGMLVVLTDANILHTILYAAANVLVKLPSMLSALGIYVFQCLLNFLIPSGSGQASVSIPVLAPLSDLVGVTRQTTCIAFQLGDAISNMITPTNGTFMAGLALAKVPWNKWVRWFLPLAALHYAVGAVFVIIAHLTGLGPF